MTKSINAVSWRLALALAVPLLVSCPVEDSDGEGGGNGSDEDVSTGNDAAVDTPLDIPVGQDTPADPGIPDVPGPETGDDTVTSDVPANDPTMEVGEDGGIPAPCTPELDTCPDGYLCACWDVGPSSSCACGLACTDSDACTDENQGVCCGVGERNEGICTSGGCACAFCE